MYIWSKNIQGSQGNIHNILSSPKLKILSLASVSPCNTQPPRSHLLSATRSYHVTDLR